jgi:hypothetical protein
MKRMSPEAFAERNRLIKEGRDRERKRTSEADAHIKDNVVKVKKSRARYMCHNAAYAKLSE